MPNLYHYFESGEVSHERLELEIELLKQLQNINLLENLDWNAYDTSALKHFHQAGIQEVSNELIRRYENHTKQYKQYDFIEKCIQKYQRSSIKETFKKQRISLHLILNMIFIFICLIFIIGLFIYQYIKLNSQHYLFQSLDRPLTTKRRHLSFPDDLSVILFTFVCTIILGSCITATRFNRKIILFGIFALIIIIIFLILKIHQIVTFLSKYRELRWSMLYDYMYS